MLDYKSVIQIPDKSVANGVKGLLLLYGSNFTVHTSLESTTFVNLLKATKAKCKTGEVRIMSNDEYAYIALVCVNDDQDDSTKPQTKNNKTNRNLINDVRCSVKKGIDLLTKLGVTEIYCDTKYMPEEVAIGAQLTYYNYNVLKTKQEDTKYTVKPLQSSPEYDNGACIGKHHNFTRFLADTPANHMTPELFCEYAKDFLKDKGLEIQVLDSEFMKKENMELFTSVTQGSSQPCKLLRIKHEDGKIALVGKGITFDSGGISLKTPKGMAAMKADMMGAAGVLATMGFVASRKLNIGVQAIIPLCENLIGPSATKPGDVKTGFKSVEIDNTDAEGRLILADAITLAEKDKAEIIVTIATLTGAVRVALGNMKIGMYSSTDSLAQEFTEAGFKCDEEVWRMPLDKRYVKDLSSHVADLRNIGNKGGGGSCLAAAFLYEFVQNADYAHLDIAGVMDDAFGFEWKGMTGKGFQLLAMWLTNRAENK